MKWTCRHFFPANCSEACFFTIIFFFFQVHYKCKWELFFELNKETSREIDRKRNWEYKQDTTKGWRSKRQLFYPFRWLIYVFNSVVNTKLPAKSFVVEFWRYVVDLHRLSLRAFKSLITMSNLREINELSHRFLGWVPSGSHHPCFFLLTVLKLYGSFINYRITRTFL